MGVRGGETGPETSYGAEDTPPRVLAETRTQQPSLLRQLQFSLRPWGLAGCGLKDPEGKWEATGALRRLSPTGKGAEVLTGTRTDGKEAPLPPRQTPATRSHHTRNTVNSLLKQRQDARTGFLPLLEHAPRWIRVDPDPVFKLAHKFHCRITDRPSHSAGDPHRAAPASWDVPASTPPPPPPVELPRPEPHVVLRAAAQPFPSASARFASCG